MLGKYDIEQMTKTPRTIEEILYVEMFPASDRDFGFKPFNATLSGQRRESFTTNEAYIYCADRMKQKLLPLTVNLRSGIAEASLRTPYKNAVVLVEGSKDSAARVTNAELPELERREDFIGIIELDAKRAEVEATHIESIPKYMYELQRKKITQTTVVNVLLQSIRYRDPFLQVGKRVFGRETDVEISDFTGKINLHKIMTAKVAPNEIKSDIKREYKIARY